MKSVRIALVIMAASMAWAGTLAARETDDWPRTYEILNSEYSLARAPNFYFVLDVAGNALELRVRGVTLRSWPLRSMRFWGKPTFQGNVELIRKSTLKAPQRVVVRPGGGDESASTTAKAEGAEFDLEALELKDMPESFSLEFDNGFHVSVMSSKVARKGLLKAIGNAWRWHIGLPLKGLFQNSSGSRLELIFEEKNDVQAIYWHFFEGIKGLII